MYKITIFADMKVLLDANILFPPTLRDLFFVLAEQNELSVFWSEKIIEEWVFNVKRTLNPLQKAVLKSLVEELPQKFPSALISDYEPIIENLKTKDEDDKHVMAAAIHGEVDYIITFNTRDFPKSTLRKYNIVPIHPDKFLCDNYSMKTNVIHHAFVDLLKNPRYKDSSEIDIVNSLSNRGLIKSMRMVKNSLPK